MFRAHPFWFILAVLLIAAFGAGILILLVWYIKTRATTVTVTDSDLLYEKGILSKNRTSVSLRHIRKPSSIVSWGSGLSKSPPPATCPSSPLSTCPIRT